jgi:signal peptide peptidase SppA
MYEPAAQELLAQVRMADPQAHVEAARAANGAGPSFEVLNGVAVIDLVGTMTKFGSSFSRLRHGTVGVRRAVRQAAAARDVSAIILRIDSPGGTVSGTGALAADVAEANKEKPVVAFIEDLGASAAYYVASQARQIVAEKDALVGSIGVYMAINDFSKMFEEAAVKTHVIRAGQFKGAGTVGTEITDAHLADFQRVVDEINEQFAQAVQKGRNLTAKQVAQLNDGRVHGATQALALKLIDKVGTMDAVLAEFSSNSGSGRGKDRAMTTEAATATSADAPKAATLAQLKEHLADATADFREHCQEQQLTLAQAKAAWTREKAKADEVAEAKKAAEDEAAKAKAAAEAVGGVKGVSAKTGNGADDGEDDPVAEFNRRVQAYKDKGMAPAAAVAKVVREDPELHERFKDAQPPVSPQRRRAS